MKILPIILALLMVSSVIAMAETTDGVNWTTQSPPINSVLNQYATHDHGLNNPDPLRMELGAGADVVVWEFDGFLQSWGADSVEIQTRWDLNNGGDFQTYGVVKMNLVRPVKALLGVE